MLTLVNACCLSGTVRSRYWRHGDLARHRSTRLPDEVRFPDKLWRRAAADLLLTPSPVRCFFCRSLCERTVVRFADNPYYLLKAYVDSNEGIDRAGGFAIQVSSRPPLTSLSVGKITDKTCFPRPFAVCTGPRLAAGEMHRRRLQQCGRLPLVCFQRVPARLDRERRARHGARRLDVISPASLATA